MPTNREYQLREAESGSDDQAVATLIVEYMNWAHGRLHEEYGVDEPPADPSLVHESLEAYRRPTGMLLLAEGSGRPVAVGAVRGLGEEVAEIKRMYVIPEARGHHIASNLLDRLMAETRLKGTRVLRLDTCRFMTDAQRLYRSRGFRERGAYEGTEIPARLQHLWLFFERDV
jgi:GNAT superfamily N-acetyltransferase